MEKDLQTYQIIGAAMEVHKQLGAGFLEKVYHMALIEEFTARNIAFEHEVHLPVLYKGKTLECYYKADFICMNDVIVETKAIEKLSNTDTAQLINYLKATGKRRGLVINFGSDSLQFERRVLGY